MQAFLVDMHNNKKQETELCPSKGCHSLAVREPELLERAVARKGHHHLMQVCAAGGFEHSQAGLQVASEHRKSWCSSSTQVLQSCVFQVQEITLGTCNLHSRFWCFSSNRVVHISSAGHGTPNLKFAQQVRVFQQ
eukprot:scaffold316830_cov21-Tisochrysis_lutea.AAC.1